MSSIVISGDTSGAITLAAPAVSGTNTATLPAATGTVMVSGNMPAFSAYKSASTQTIPNSTLTKITFDVESFDTNNNFASSRFTPTVAGYYWLNFYLSIGSGTGSYEVVPYLYKNGSAFKSAMDMNSSTFTIGGSMLVFANGTTDYFEVYLFQGSGGNKDVMNYSSQTYFEGFLARTA